MGVVGSQNFVSYPSQHILSYSDAIPCHIQGGQKQSPYIIATGINASY